MLEKLISKEMTAALADVLANMPKGRRTAAHASLTDASVEAFKAGYRDLQSFLKDASKSLKLEQHQINVGMGNWISSGNVFPHLWGALFPSEGRKVSGTVPQLFIIRKPDAIRWGISLSVKSQAHPASSIAISEFLQDRQELKSFRERGFELENDSTVAGHEKPTQLVKTVKIASAES